MPRGSSVTWYRIWLVIDRWVDRKTRQFRRWLENTSHLENLSVLVFTPLLIAAVTLLSNSIEQLSFLLFPPLASGTYTLFADPESQYSNPVKFVGGMTLGAFIGWVSLEFFNVIGPYLGARTVELTAGGAALGLFLTGLFTWTLDLEEPTAFSTALLVLITGTSQLAYVISVAVSSSFVAIVFVTWRDRFFEQRARYLYSTTRADNDVLVAMRTQHAKEAAWFGARMAAADDSGRVVLLELVDQEAIAAAERELIEREETENPPDGAEYIADAESQAEERAADWAARTLEQQAVGIESELGIPCEVIVAVDEEDTPGTIIDTAARTDTDLVIAPFEYEERTIPEYVTDLFTTELDVVAFRGYHGRDTWNRIMVTVNRPDDLANAMMDYTGRLIGEEGMVSACTCIGDERERRTAERVLEDVIDVTNTRCETRISRSPFDSYLERNADQFDLVLLGASRDRSAASRLRRPPTYERVADLETDLAVVHHG